MPEPINSKTLSAQKPVQPKQPQKVKIGGVEYNREHIEKSETNVKNGKKEYSVFVKPGVQIVYPEQTSGNATVESLGLRKEWYNPDESCININDLEGASIYGIPNKSDYISLGGKSKNNTIVVDQKESWYINGDMRRDYVIMYDDTSNNTVVMDKKDKLSIGYTHPTIEQGESPYGYLQVNGKGTSEQEVQLKHDLGDNGYRYHKFRQQNPSLFSNW